MAKAEYQNTGPATFPGVGGVGGLMVTALNSRSSGLGSSPGWAHCVVLGKTLPQCLSSPG